ncbi:hypothetical protein LRS10_13520 [Phenylobacterium sp. J426]|uniref:hypothetical protein n=1 Tax=Phenylobacterium sp. J426 TaxID=2898439 RepID=UPI002151E25A|nr:hypothetical protein [Phenylobacterium sp. J426]MCR5875112.1 hypothetical protein [Phenylobacterium sp. J426]
MRKVARASAWQPAVLTLNASQSPRESSPPDGAELDLDGLEKVARAATHGLPCGWKYQVASATVVTNPGLGLLVARPHEGAIIRAEAVGEHIATFDPPTVLRLIREKQAAERLLEEVVGALDYAQTTIDAAALRMERLGQAEAARVLNAEAQDILKALARAKSVAGKDQKSSRGCGDDPGCADALPNNKPSQDPQGAVSQGGRMMARRDHDIKAPDGYLLGGLRRVRSDGTILFQRGYWQAPKEWAGQEVWVHTLEPSSFDSIEAAQPGLHIYEARCMKPEPFTVRCGRTGRPDAKPAYRRPEHKAWATRSSGAQQ